MEGVGWGGGGRDRGARGIIFYGRQKLVFYDMVSYSTVLYIVWYSIVLYIVCSGIVRYGAVWYGVLNGTVLYGTVWYGMTCSASFLCTSGLFMFRRSWRLYETRVASVFSPPRSYSQE